MSNPNRKTRPARSNSLQRMLELERRYMMERLQSSATPTKTTAPSLVASSTTMGSSPSQPRSTIQVRRTEIQTQKDARKSTKSPPPATAPQIAPLAIDTSVTQPKPEAVVGSDKTTTTDDPATASNPSPDKISSKIVSFDIPASEDQDDRRSICQSPSWEAYDRRKKEKTEEKKDQKKELKKEQKKDQKKELKELKKEKEKEKEREREREKEKLKEKEKEKEEAAKAAMVKKKRLSKNPPTSSSHALDQASRMSRGESATNLDKPRPASAIGLTTPPQDESTQRRPRSRSRSGSLSSLFRKPFESRRASVDTPAASETGFVGGIKLEMERHAAYQKVLDEQLKSEKADEANIHPALRSDKAEQTAAHLESVSPPSKGKAADAQRRAYPPITRLTSPGKSRSLVLPTSSSTPEVGTMDRWKAFVGMKSASKPGAAESKTDVTAEDTKKSTVPDAAGKQLLSKAPQPRQVKGADMTVASGSFSPSSERPKTAMPQNSPQSISQNSVKEDQGNQRQPKTPSPVEQMAKAKSEAENQMANVFNQKLVAQTAMIPPNALQMSPAGPSAAPPEPPQRSPKRNSLQSLNGSVPPLNSPSEGPAPRSPRRPGSSGASVSSVGDARFVLTPNSERPNPMAKHSSDSRFSSPNRLNQLDSSSQDHSGSGKSSMDSLDSHNELATSGVSLKPMSPRQAARANAGKGPELVGTPTWEDIQSSVMQTIETKVSLSPIRKSHSFLRDDSDFTVRRLTDDSVPATSSSDDLSSDEFHSPSMPGTPDTSRPQSEKGAPPLFSDIEQRLMSQDEVHLRSQDSRSPVREPVSSTAYKSPKAVLGAYDAGRTTAVHVTQIPHLTQGRPSTQIRAHSENDLMTETSFLPKLKHQPLKPTDKLVPAPRPMVVASPRPSREKMMANHQPWPASYLEEARKATPLAPPPRVLGSPQITPKGTPPPSVRSNPSSSTTDVTTKAIKHSPSSGTVTPGGDPIAKMFVECCSCKYYHDMPSNIYEAMANPEAVISPRNNVEFSGLISMTVRCPWCNHEMSTKCCAGYAAMVYVKQRLH